MKEDQNLQTATLPLKILVAEDDPDDREFLKEAFEQIDPAIQFVSFSTGKSFLCELENMPSAPDMIVLDYNIPELNGAELLQHINGKEQYDSMVKIVWSTSNSPFYEKTCLAQGANAYFVKPSSLAGLTELAKTMLAFIK